MLMCVGCFGLVVSNCQVIGLKDPSEDTLTWSGDNLHIAQVESLPQWLSGLRHSAHRPEQSAGGAGFNPRVGR